MQPPTRQQLSLFISYRRVDSEFVDRLEVDLRVRDFDTWLDRRDLASRGGANWRRELQIAIDKAHAVVLVMTPDAADSPYVGWEYRYAVTLGRPIYVLLLKDCPKGVPAEVLAHGSRWLDFRAEADYSRQLHELVELLMDLPLDPLPPRPEGVKFGEDRPISLLPLGVIEQAQSSLQNDAEFDELYRRAVQAEIASNLDRATDLFQRILNANPTYRNNYIGNRMPELLQKRRQVWIERLKQIAYQARLEGEWGLEIAAWNAMMTETGGEPRAQQGLALARHNQSFAWLYKEALSAYNNGDIPAARHQIEQLWQQAPDYGDPARLAPELGMPVRQARESTGLLGPDIVRAAQAALDTKKSAPKAAPEPPSAISETDELDALSPTAEPYIAAPFPLAPGERVVRHQGVSWYHGMGWSQRTLYLTNRRIVLMPTVMSILNTQPYEVRFDEIASIERGTVLFVNPVVKITLTAGAEVQFILNELGGLMYGNREEFIALVRQLMQQ